MYKHSHNISRNIIVYFDSTHFRVALLYFMNWMPSLKAAFIYFLALYTRLVVQWFVSCILYITSIAFYITQVVYRNHMVSSIVLYYVLLALVIQLVYYFVRIYNMMYDSMLNVFCLTLYTKYIHLGFIYWVM